MTDHSHNYYHSANLGRIAMNPGMPDSTQTQRLSRLLMTRLLVDQALL